LVQLKIYEALTPQEYAVAASAGKSKKLQNMAQKHENNLNAVFTAKSMTEKKPGKSNLRGFLFTKTFPGISLSLITVQDIKNILTPLEFDFFVLYKDGSLTYSQIASVLGQNNKNGTLLQRIKKKLGIYYRPLVDPNFKINGLKTRRSIADVSSSREGCGSCMNFLAALEQDKKVYCLQEGLTEEKDICRSYNRYIIKKRLQERELLEERLNDPGYLKMAYSIGVNGYEPQDSIEKSQLAIAALGYRNFHSRRRSLHRKTIEYAARYAVIPLTAEERNEPDVKLLLKHLNISSVKTDFDCHCEMSACKESSNCYDCRLKYSTSYYVIKDAGHYQRVIGALVGPACFYISEDGMLNIFFEKKVSIKSVFVKKSDSGEEVVLNIDKSGGFFKKEHAVDFYDRPGEYIITIVVGRGHLKKDDRWNAALKYRIVVEREDGRLVVKKQELFF